MIKKLQTIAVLLPLLLLCGCVEVADELTVEADGSGIITLEVRSQGGDEMGAMFGMFPGKAGQVYYPPINEEEARKFFPANDFTVEVEQERASDGVSILRVRAAFEDINKVLAGEYGRAHALTLEKEDGALVLKAKTGMEGVARITEREGETSAMFGQMFAALGKSKDAGKVKVNFAVTLPNTINAGNGEQDGKTTRWNFDRTDFEDANAFAEKLGTVLEARCSLDGVTFSPETPLRLDLLPFDELQAGAMTERAAPDAEKIKAAVTFVPYALSVSRSLDLSGRGGRMENQAQLIGAVVLPREFAPDRWGEARLEEAVDASGRDLMPRRDGFDFPFARTRYFGMDDDEDEETDSAEARQRVTLSFQPPEWEVARIARVRGSMPLSYFGGSRVVKVAEAIPEAWIARDESAMMRFFSGDGERVLSSPALAEIGLVLELEMAMAQEGMLILSLEAEDDGPAVTGVQVFDAEGRPWPTFMPEEGMMGDLQVVVAGTPKAPLSLALTVSDLGASVEVPIVVENVPVSNK